MKVHTLQLGPLRANCHIAETAPNQCVAVDIGGDSRLFLEFITMKKLKLSKILLTHGHFDHIGGVEEVRKATGAQVYIHGEDAPMLSSEGKSLHSTMSFMPFSPVTEYITVSDNSVIHDGDCDFTVIHTPAHTPGSVCYMCDDVLFTGDTLFCCSVGRTDFPGSDPSLLLPSLRKLCSIEHDLKVLTGHNEFTTLDYEKKNNPFMQRCMM
ncbi:MAG: MBL fold metallo-hydrolase [Ruminococcus sp.]|nr:MBL fold metallo-hydrolase [Ruminococcus sp.]